MMPSIHKPDAGMPRNIAPTRATAPSIGAKRDRWVEALSHLSPKYGGLTAAVPQLSRNLVEWQDLRIDIASFSQADETQEVPSSTALSVTGWPASRMAWWLDRRLYNRLRNFVHGVDGFHLHGLWEAHTSLLSRTARMMGKPYIISAHGMLDPWALANKGWKKRLYSVLIERPNLEGAACLHALTVAEAQDYRRFGCRKPIAIIPNGIDLPRTVDSLMFADLYPAIKGRRVVLFLGRLHFKKGLDILVQAWAMTQPCFPDAVLVLAGPDCENSQETIQEMVTLLGIRESVIFTGMLEGSAKWGAFAAAHAFVLPSYSEGFSVAVLEAMGMGLPVIVSHECHVPEVATSGAGWQIKPQADELAQALQALLKNTAATNAEIGNRGRHLVRERFNSKVVTQQMADLYKWVQGGPRPHSFELLEVGA